MAEKVIPRDEIKFQNNYITTSQLAKFCGVSRFTIINWIKQDKIKAIKTAGGHHRIYLSEVISFLETIHRERKRRGALSVPSVCCWEYAERKGDDKNCRNCLIYKREIDYCFLLAREFGKGVVCCEKDCLHCDYFNEFFNKKKKAEESQKVEHIEMNEKVTEGKKNFFENFSYSVGLGMQGLKKRIADLKKRVMER
ncbi:MAG: helix-turn-helix domain-containing protein [Candidatus Omnitrophota bacterium]|nr:MAG: helix-turn-helix domain-containing protein [Candidatus Omnitrophota bacterium]